MPTTFKCHVEDDDRRIRADDAIRALAGHLGGEGVPDDEWFVKWTEDGKQVCDPDPIGMIAGHREVIEAAEKGLRSQVWLARRMGRSWTEIGEALGVSKQAVARRFKGIA